MTTTPTKTQNSKRCSIDLESELPGDTPMKVRNSTMVLTLQSWKRIAYAAGTVIFLITVLSYSIPRDSQHRRLPVQEYCPECQVESIINGTCYWCNAPEPEQYADEANRPNEGAFEPGAKPNAVAPNPEDAQPSEINWAEKLAYAKKGGWDFYQTIRTRMGFGISSRTQENLPFFKKLNTWIENKGSLSTNSDAETTDIFVFVMDSQKKIVFENQYKRETLTKAELDEFLSESVDRVENDETCRPIILFHSPSAKEAVKKLLEVNKDEGKDIKTKHGWRFPKIQEEKNVWRLKLGWFGKIKLEKIFVGWKFEDQKGLEGYGHAVQFETYNITKEGDNTFMTWNHQDHDLRIQKHTPKSTVADNRTGISKRFQAFVDKIFG